MRQLFGRPDKAHERVEMLSAFLDNQVGPAERARIESHLHTCAVCRRELESLRCTVALLHALPRVATPRAFTLSEAEAGIRRPEPRTAWLGGVVRGLGAVTAVALVVVVAATVLRQPQWPWTRTAPATSVTGMQSATVNQSTRSGRSSRISAGKDSSHPSVVATPARIGHSSEYCSRTSAARGQS